MGACLRSGREHLVSEHLGLLSYTTVSKRLFKVLLIANFTTQMNHGLTPAYKRLSMVIANESIVSHAAVVCFVTQRNLKEHCVTKQTLKRALRDETNNDNVGE